MTPRSRRGRRARGHGFETLLPALSAEIKTPSALVRATAWTATPARHLLPQMCRRDDNNQPMSRASRIGTLDAMITPRTLTAFALLAAAVGIVIQIALFLIFGLFAADQASRLIEVDTVLDTLGLWIQMVAVVVALVTAVIALVNPRPSSSDA